MPDYVIGDNKAGEDVMSYTERVTNALPVITTDHGFIHSGIAFTSAGTMVIGNGDTGGLQFKTPVMKYIHFKAANISSNAAVTVSLLEKYSAVAATASIAANNRNRISSVTASTIVTAGLAVTPVAATGAVTLGTTLLGANLPAYKVGGETSSAEEWVFARDTNYMVAIANASGGNATVSYDLFWYEEDGA